MKWTRLDTADAALTELGHFANGYVVWDRNVRTSINVALTAAGVLRGVVVDESLIPLAEKHGLKPLADFRGKFTGQTDLPDLPAGPTTNIGRTAAAITSSGWVARQVT